MSEPLNRKYEIGKVYPININELQPTPEQPRKYFDEGEIKALAADIEANGLLQNITFTCHEDKLIIISGERRVRAHNQLGKEVIEGKYVEGDLLTLALMENILRSDLTAIEFAESVAALQKQKNCSNDDIARIIGKKKSTTSEILKIASLPEKIRNDARTKPYMTRERLLKVARRKDADIQKKTYNKLCHMLEKPENAPRKSSEKSQGNKKTGNRFVNAHIRKIERMTEDLNVSYEKMHSKIKTELTDEEKQGLIIALEKMRTAIEVIIPKQ
ncbi:ParB/RepB/Spo0J family partition protein [Desulfovibrio intestinalis]|uniref:ParB family chromosome partitioning protein n=1 Tax=Desulfovibrio intestinalis TaxID=58621 RepID=A0A7W8BYJ1_9BACT|nr:ParB/RepB/Spo0J family partition protein [Desulfovibrio intestinalis]MBB5142297.1 ParB family chromosome partitioning protein [Desulfovibrio intestinalis]